MITQPPIKLIRFWALSEANKELTPNQATNTISTSDKATPIANCDPLRNPCVILVWIKEKNAGPTIRDNVNPNNIPCVIILKLIIRLFIFSNKTGAKVQIKTDSHKDCFLLFRYLNPFFGILQPHHFDRKQRNQILNLTQKTTIRHYICCKSFFFLIFAD